MLKTGGPRELEQFWTIINKNRQHERRILSRERDLEERAPIPTLLRRTVRPQSLVLDGLFYHRIDSSDIPPGFTTVSVKIDDNGDEFDTLMLAVLVGIRVTSSGEQLTPPHYAQYLAPGQAAGLHPCNQNRVGGYSRLKARIK
jgi:hypothetical protein